MYNQKNLFEIMNNYKIKTTIVKPFTFDTKKQYPFRIIVFRHYDILYLLLEISPLEVLCTTDGDFIFFAFSIFCCINL